MPQNYEELVQSYLTQPVQVVSAAHAVDEMFTEYDLPHLRPYQGGSLNSGFWVPLHIVCASVYEPHRSSPETHKMLNFMKINDARSYFFAELSKRKLRVVEIWRADTWETSKVRFSPGSNSDGLFGLHRNITPDIELRELMEEALRVLSSIARMENAKAVGQL